MRKGFAKWDVIFCQMPGASTALCMVTMERAVVPVHQNCPSLMWGRLLLVEGAPGMAGYAKGPERERKTPKSYSELIQNFLSLIFLTWQEEAENIVSAVHLKNSFSSWVKTILDFHTFWMKDFLPWAMLSTQTLHRICQPLLMFCFTYFSKSQIFCSIK